MSLEPIDPKTALELYLADRENVFEQVLEIHYDQRTEKVKMEQRRESVDTL
jgi:hypothetical protein